jgi:hyaluronan synthase
MSKQNTSYVKIKKFLSFIDYIIHINTFLLIIGAGIVLYRFQHQFQEIREMLMTSIPGIIFLILSVFALVFKVLFLLFLFYKFLKYRPIKSVSDDLLPSCTVIIPAYNEGRFVYDTIISVAESDYPAHKIELIAIDDGSQDDTWSWIRKAGQQLGDRLIVLRHPHNAGKRQALYHGINMGKGEIFVTIDSDSLISKDTIRNLVSPFVTDENCGAVAGNVRIYNINHAIIPKMLNVSFAFSFGFIRAAQSVMKTVLCTPGALSAYRRAAVMPCLNEWINQTFLGVKTDIGEDRAMTNMIIKQGYNTLYQSNACVQTNIPETYRTLRKMFTRWERSNVRENIMMSRFAFTTFRFDNLFNARLLLFNQWLNIISAYPSLIFMCLIIAAYPRLFLSSTVISVAIFSVIPALFYSIKHNKKNALWIFTYNLFYTFTLFWITPFAIITARKRGWLTREITK